jgi:hypothetical protein
VKLTLISLAFSTLISKVRIGFGEADPRSVPRGNFTQERVSDTVGEGSERGTAYFESVVIFVCTERLS